MTVLHNVSADPASPVSRGQRAWSILGQSLLWIVLFLSMLKLPSPPAGGLDPSWRMVIGNAVGSGVQWGTDLVFTYGPLGYLLASTNHGEHYSHFLIWQAVSNVIFATVIWLFGRQFRGWRAVIYYLYFVCFVANYLDSMHVTMVLLMSLALLRENVAARRWLVALIGIGLAVLSLVKFTNLMLAGFAILCVAGHHIWRRRWFDLALAFGSYAMFFIVGWLLCGQSPANIPAYVFTSLNASSGYGEGMSFYETRIIFWMGVLSACTLGGYFVATLWRRSDLARALAAMLIAAAGAFMNWKHGYIRADGHVFAHYISCMLIAVTFPVLLSDDGPLPRTKSLLLSLSTIACFAGILIAVPTAVTDAPAIWNYNLKSTINALRILPDLKRNADAEFSSVARPHLMPGMRSVVGDDTVDMIGNEQAYMIFNRFNYHPRPVFQSYLPYTPKLAKLNERFFQSNDRAPKFVIQKMDTIDFRVPGLEDSLSTRYLYYHYRYVMEEKGMLLWKRAEHDPALDKQAPISSMKVGFNDTVAVPDLGDVPVWAEIVVRQSLLGKLRGFLYKAPHLQLAVVDGGGFKNNYRFIRQLGETGFFVYPHFSGNYNVQRYITGEPAPRMATFRVEVPDHQRKYFRDDIEVRFLRMPEMPRSKGAVAQTSAATFRMFDRAPVAINALYPVANIESEGREVLFVHPPSTLEFLVDFPASRVRGKFGLAPNAHVAPNYTDGAEFIVEWNTGGESKQLFARNLQPGKEEGDRGIQSFDVAIPPGGGRLILRITPGPSGDIACDWTYWTEVRFVP